MAIADLFSDAPEDFRLVTERLLLRLPQRKDRAARLRLRTIDYQTLHLLEPEWTPDHLTYQGCAAWESFCLEQYHERRGLNLFIYDRFSGAPVGCCEAVRLCDKPLASAMVGYWISSTVRGQGYMPEALRALSMYLHGVGEVARIEAGCLAHNTPSHKVLRKTGFTQEGLMREFAEINGRRQDHILFARLADDPLQANS